MSVTREYGIQSYSWMLYALNEVSFPFQMNASLYALLPCPIRACCVSAPFYWLNNNVDIPSIPNCTFDWILDWEGQQRKIIMEMLVTYVWQIEQKIWYLKNNMTKTPRFSLAHINFQILIQMHCTCILFFQFLFIISLFKV